MSYISKLRKIVGKTPLIMPCVGAIIVNEKKQILLQKRKDNSTWALHGGAIEIDESIEEALLREVKEETGLILDSYEFFKIYSGKKMHHVYPNGDEVSLISIIYIVNSYHGKLTPQEEEVIELRYFSYDEIKKLNLHSVDIEPINDYFKLINH